MFTFRISFFIPLSAESLQLGSNKSQMTDLDTYARVRIHNIYSVTMVTVSALMIMETYIFLLCQRDVTNYTLFSSQSSGAIIFHDVWERDARDWRRNQQCKQTCCVHDAGCLVFGKAWKVKKRQWWPRLCFSVPPRSTNNIIPCACHEGKNSCLLVWLW